jgi:hypothetical protein
LEPVPWSQHNVIASADLLEAGARDADSLDAVAATALAQQEERPFAWRELKNALVDLAEEFDFQGTMRFHFAL